MKDGYLGISRARYSLGVKRVSVDQFLDADLKATSKISIADEDQFVGNKESNVIPKLELQVIDIKSINKSDSCEINKKSTEKTEGPRLRKNIDKDQGSNKPDITKEFVPEISKAQSTDECKKDSDNQRIFNPIHLFGVLVPQSLRKAQKDFENTIQLTVKIANLQNELQLLYKSYSSLMEKKNVCMLNISAEA